ncbi:MAG: hypothetical protein J6M53_09150 [Bacteroidaceae bacterium]|nr:hypothetical protein [Bacteroidaceae bacterium]
MKAIKFIALLAFMASTFAFTACDSEAKDGDVPDNLAASRQMVIGLWKAPYGISFLHHKDYDEYYREVTTTQLTIIGHVSKYATTEKMKPYADQYVLHHQYPITAITIDSSDPTKGTITYTKDGKSETLAFERLTSTSIVFTDDGDLRSSKQEQTIQYVNPK